MSCSPTLIRLAELLTMLREPHDSHKLTFAAEEVGRLCVCHHRDREDEVVATLLPLLEHDSPLVREGALYGLGPFVERPDVWQRVLRITWADISSGVRAAATELVEFEGG